MSEVIERVIEKLNKMAPDQQQFVADLVNGLTDAGTTPVEISVSEQAVVDRAMTEIAAGDIATEAEVAAYRHRAR